MEFLEEVESGIQSILHHPEMHAIVHKQIRRCVLHRFPYGLFYIHNESSASIISCFHASRDPKQWQRRT